MRDGPLVGVDAEPWAHRRHPVGLVGPDPGRAHPGLRQTTLQVGGLAAVDQHVQLDLARPRPGIRRTKPPPHRRRSHLGGQRVQSERVEHRLAQPSCGPSSDSTARSAGAGVTSDQNTILRR